MILKWTKDLTEQNKMVKRERNFDKAQKRFDSLYEQSHIGMIDKNDSSPDTRKKNRDRIYTGGRSSTHETCHRNFYQL